MKLETYFQNNTEFAERADHWSKVYIDLYNEEPISEFCDDEEIECYLWENTEYDGDCRGFARDFLRSHYERNNMGKLFDRKQDQDDIQHRLDDLQVEVAALLTSAVKDRIKEQLQIA